MSLKPNRGSKRRSSSAAPPENPARADVERDPRWETLLSERLRASYREYARFLYSLAKDKNASFEGLQEHEAVRCIHSCLAEISLCLEQHCLRERVSSLRVERTEAEVRAWFGNDSLDLSSLARSTAIATDRLGPEDAQIVSDIIIDQLFHDEIRLPGFAQEVVNGDTLVFTLLPDDAEAQLLYREGSRTPNSLVG